jgi:hypothetical protein
MPCQTVKPPWLENGWHFPIPQPSPRSPRTPRRVACGRRSSDAFWQNRRPFCGTNNLAIKPMDRRERPVPKLPPAGHDVVWSGSPRIVWDERYRIGDGKHANINPLSRLNDRKIRTRIRDKKSCHQDETPCDYPWLISFAAHAQILSREMKTRKDDPA